MDKNDFLPNEFQLTPNFNLREFREPGTGIVLIWPPVVYTLQKARDILKSPIRVTSGFRSHAYNKTVPGADPNSGHIYGLCADVTCDAVGPEKLAAACREAGFPIVKEYPPSDTSPTGHVHVGYQNYSL